MEDINPYAAPRHDLALGAAPNEPGDSVWRDGNLLVMRKGAVLPDCCVKCNSPAEGRRLKVTLRWHDPIYFLLFPIAPIIVLFIVQSAKIEVGICGRHRRQRRFAILASRLLFVAGVASLVVAVGGEPPSVGPAWSAALLAVGVAMLAGASYGSFVTAVTSTHKIDREYVWLKNVGPDYLAQFPPFVG